MISNGVNALLVRCVDSAAAGSIAEMAHEAGVLYIAYDTMTNTGPVDYFVTNDPVQAGELMAQTLLDNAPTGNYVIINGNPGSSYALSQYEGVMNVLQPAVDRGDITIVADQWCQAYDPAIALQHAQAALTANNNDIQAMYIANDTMATPVIAELESQGLEDKIFTTGQDADLAACQRIVEGKQTMTIYKPVVSITENIFKIIMAHVNGENVEEAVSGGVWTVRENEEGKEIKTYLCDAVVATKDTMIDTVIADGYRTYEDVYANVPEAERPPKP
jgi:D-xylose transport system substrate-binding protein